jgi:hypothetical protein
MCHTEAALCINKIVAFQPNKCISMCGSRYSRRSVPAIAAPNHLFHTFIRAILPSAATEADPALVRALAEFEASA